LETKGVHLTRNKITINKSATTLTIKQYFCRGIK
jgi:hypothetical protein